MCQEVCAVWPITPQGQNHLQHTHNSALTPQRRLQLKDICGLCSLELSPLKSTFSKICFPPHFPQREKLQGNRIVSHKVCQSFSQLMCVMSGAEGALLGSAMTAGRPVCLIVSAEECRSPCMDLILDAFTAAPTLYEVNPPRVQSFFAAFLMC